MWRQSQFFREFCEFPWLLAEKGNQITLTLKKEETALQLPEIDCFKQWTNTTHEGFSLVGDLSGCGLQLNLISTMALIHFSRER